jgi:hypothetical protein
MSGFVLPMSYVHNSMCYWVGCDVNIAFNSAMITLIQMSCIGVLSCECFVYIFIAEVILNDPSFIG